ncbi:hypothetical protein D9758_009010 [Tetrapyrgos nigripes]|uniref:Uncharacterized protein n=1 Tax=Tetrapyrgos nigripes TaxID=182062 RepID=A0A8H5GK31_9AGAR|nr:hypothetical protein D9758_014386 [Tetrapyrgos nigripes]KAF5366559.1 hypothetical protein D9758_009010 [Tetrapyrgos nigripes]
MAKSASSHPHPRQSSPFATTRQQVQVVVPTLAQTQDQGRIDGTGSASGSKAKDTALDSSTASTPNHVSTTNTNVPTTNFQANVKSKTRLRPHTTPKTRQTRLPRPKAPPKNMSPALVKQLPPPFSRKPLATPVSATSGAASTPAVTSFKDREAGGSSRNTVFEGTKDGEGGEGNGVDHVEHPTPNPSVLMSIALLPNSALGSLLWPHAPSSWISLGSLLPVPLAKYDFVLYNTNLRAIRRSTSGMGGEGVAGAAVSPSTTDPSLSATMGGATGVGTGMTEGIGETIAAVTKGSSGGG